MSTEAWIIVMQIVEHVCIFSNQASIYILVKKYLNLDLHQIYKNY